MGILLPEIFLRYVLSFFCFCLTALVSIESPILKTDSFCGSFMPSLSSSLLGFLSSCSFLCLCSLSPFFSLFSSSSFLCCCLFSSFSSSCCFFLSCIISSSFSVSKLGGSNGFLRILCGSANSIASFMSSKVTFFLPSSAAIVFAVLSITISARCVLTPSSIQVSAVIFSKSSLISTSLIICFACTIFSRNSF